MRIAKIASLMLKIFVSIVFLFALATFGLYFGLVNGIKIDQLSFSNFKAEQFYLKLDKKIIFIVDKLEIDKDDTEGLFTPKINGQTISLAQKIIDNFELIHIKEFRSEEINGSFKLDGQNIILASSLADLNASYKHENEKYHITLSHFFLKDKKIAGTGELFSDIKTKAIEGNLSLAYKNVKLEVKIDKPQDIATLEVSSNTLYSLEVLKDFITFEGAIDEWLFKRLAIKAFKVNNLKVVYDTHKEALLYDKLYANIFINGIRLKFHDNANAVTAKSANVTLSNTNLAMSFVEPQLEDKLLVGSKATINSLFSAPSLSLDVQYNAKLDRVIFDVLKAYKIDVPHIEQSQGSTQANMAMFLPFDDRELKITVNASTKESEYILNNQKIKAKTLYFKYDKDIFVTDSEVSMNDINASIDSLVFYLQNQLVQFHGNVVLPQVGKVALRSNASLNDENFAANIVVDAFKYENYIDMTNTTLDVYGSFKNGLSVVVPKWNVQYINKEDLHTISIANISEIAKLSPVAREYNIDDGMFELQTKNFNNIDFSFVIRNPELPVDLKSNKKDVTVFAFKGKKVGEHITLEEKNKLIKIIKHDAIVAKIRNLHIIQKGQKNQLESTSTQTHKTLYEHINTPLNLPRVDIEVTNSVFEDLNEKQYKIDDLQILAHQDDVEIALQMGVTRLNLDKKGKKLELSAIKVTDKFLNFIANKEIFYNGYASLKATGTTEKVDGFLNAYDLDVVGVPVVNNITKGSAFFSFDFKKELLDINNIDTIGSVIDMRGKVAVDLKNYLIDGNLDVVFINTIADAIRQIPLIGYIFFGNDAKLHVNTTIKGKMSEPKIETHFVKGTSEGVVNILKRILMLPVTAIETMNKAANQETKE